MDRTAIATGVLVACCVLAVALAAAALQSPVVVDGSGEEGDGSTEVDVGDAGDGPFRLGPREAPPDPDQFGFLPAIVGRICWPPIVDPFVLMALSLAYLSVGWLATRRYDLGVGVTIVVLCAIVTLVAMLVLVSGCPWWGFPEPQEAIFGEGGERVPESEESGGGETASPLSLPTVVLVGLLAMVLGGVLAALYVDGADDEDEEEEQSAPPPDDPTRIGAVAGRTADELEDDADLENAVYRAWVDMTDALSVERPESSTPGEFAAAAVDAGIDPDDVKELTTLFEAVRYGPATPTEQRERRAVETLRRIEATYDEGGSS